MPMPFSLYFTMQCGVWAGMDEYDGVAGGDDLEVGAVGRTDSIYIYIYIYIWIDIDLDIDGWDWECDMAGGY